MIHSFQDPTTTKLTNQKDDHRIVGGQNTTIDKHPHMVNCIIIIFKAFKFI